MRAHQPQQLDNLYCLVLGGDGVGDRRIIEFEASGSASALLVAGRHCHGRNAEVFENGRPLCSLRNEAEGYWVITRPHAAELGHDSPTKHRSLRAVMQLAK